jgi:hypothetical protein
MERGIRDRPEGQTDCQIQVAPDRQLGTGGPSGTTTTTKPHDACTIPDGPLAGAGRRRGTARQSAPVPCLFGRHLAPSGIFSVTRPLIRGQHRPRGSSGGAGSRNCGSGPDQSGECRGFPLANDHRTSRKCRQDGVNCGCASFAFSLTSRCFDRFAGEAGASCHPNDPTRAVFLGVATQAGKPCAT